MITDASIDALEIAMRDNVGFVLDKMEQIMNVLVDIKTQHAAILTALATLAENTNHSIKSADDAPDAAPLSPAS